MFNTELIVKQTFVATIEHHVELTSTNDRAIAWATEGTARLPLLVTAERQTAGRGRGANQWWTGPGSLAFSLLLGPDQLRGVSHRNSGLIAMAAGVAVTEALAPLLPGHTVGIHWPNDVMADDLKLTGILIESFAIGHWVVGIGVNINNTVAEAPQEIRSRVGTLRDLTGHCHDATDVLVAVLRQFESQIAVLGSEPRQLTAKVDRLCLQRGRVVTRRQGDRTITGRCLGVAPDGALRMETPEGQQLVYSGTDCGS